ncbi:hypothetical protein CBR_g32716 [Chara braunii]|uniref:CCHC-type domain-containing protein n=1 Tax=Chara braunii TaxID=69332 RepID=A0A388LHC2_CHABU|nr:hypothetical protein CBR_g32716 [Chara braunii]|eukprot:GBG81724.1 hypothetical protein CBR_g32716 [Chara braunii]
MEVAGDGPGMPQETEAHEQEKVYGKPREEAPVDKAASTKKKFRYQIPILTMPEIDDTLSKLLGTMVSVSFQTVLQASPRLLKGLRQLLTRRRIEVEEGSEQQEEEKEEEAPGEVANFQRIPGALNELEKAFADIRLSLPDCEGVAGDMFPAKCEPYIDDNPIKGARDKDETKIQPGIRRGKKKVESEEDDDEGYGKKGDSSRSRKNGGDGDRGNRERRKYDNRPKQSFVCYYCGEGGHTTTYCRPLEEDVKSGVAKKDAMGHVCDSSWNKLDPRHPGGMRFLALKHDEKMKKKIKRKTNVNVHFLIDELPNELVQETSDPHTAIELSLQSLTLIKDASDEVSTSIMQGVFRVCNRLLELSQLILTYALPAGDVMK